MKNMLTGYRILDITQFVAGQLVPELWLRWVQM